MSSPIYDVAVIGGGIVGLATAMALTARHVGLSLIVLEAEDKVFGTERLVIVAFVAVRFVKNADKAVKFLQIWVFPKTKNVTPRYDQLALNEEDRQNKLQQILSPNTDDEGVWIHQDAWFHLGKFDNEKTADYSLKKEGNGVYAFILNGSFTINGIELDKRDGLGIWNTKELSLKATTQGSEILLMEVPMAI